MFFKAGFRRFKGSSAIPGPVCDTVINAWDYHDGYKQKGCTVCQGCYDRHIMNTVVLLEWVGLQILNIDGDLACFWPGWRAHCHQRTVQIQNQGEVSQVLYA